MVREKKRKLLQYYQNAILEEIRFQNRMISSGGSFLNNWNCDRGSVFSTEKEEQRIIKESL